MVRTLVHSFTEHPESVGETYSEHLVFATQSGATMIAAGIAAVLHGLFPFLFVHTASGLMGGLSRTLAERRTAAGVAD